VVKSNVAIVGPWVRFPDGAFFLLLLPHSNRSGPEALYGPSLKISVSAFLLFVLSSTTTIDGDPKTTYEHKRIEQAPISTCLSPSTCPVKARVRAFVDPDSRQCPATADARKLLRPPTPTARLLLTVVRTRDKQQPYDRSNERKRPILLPSGGSYGALWFCWAWMLWWPSCWRRL
jgi:hypothetical protein